MAHCPHCGVELPALESPAAFCVSCGKALPPVDRSSDRMLEPGHTTPIPDPSSPSDPEAMATVAAPPPSPSARSRPAARSGSAAGTQATPPPSTVSGQRFAAGQVLGERYRIVALLGRGGMGEVYRAEDLRIEETVALKFLPSELGTDAVARARLRDEVRVTRQVSHPNVCRVHDLAEVSGELCIAMEFIDGEDLASLLRRIGHLPPDKGVEVARQLCAGIAAAHARGVLHRDLKPANVMLDGQGSVKVNDFGIAALVEAAGDPAGFAGTPLYMAPEVLAGGPATVASDIYAVGLVLHELFTGRRAITGSSIAEIQRWHEDGGRVSLTTSSTLDPAVARTIERCLDPDPSERPSSATTVAAMLPGGDPLLAALAAGETPSPELVAAAGGTGCVSKRAGSALIAAVVVAVALVVWLDQRARVPSIAPLPHEPATLAFVGKGIITSFGHEIAEHDACGAITPRDILVRHIEKTDIASDRWTRLAEPGAAAMMYWLRTSPRPLWPREGNDGRARLGDPPLDLPGMTQLQIGASSKRLLGFRAVLGPEREESEAGEAPEPPWDAVLAAAGLVPGSIEERAPARIPDMRFDARRAWQGDVPGVDGLSTIIEAAAWRGQIVWVHGNDQWPQGAPRGDLPVPGEWRRRVTEGGLDLAMLFIPLLLGAWFGIVNVRAGRSDRVGADRLAVFIIATSLIAWTLRAHHAFDDLTVEYAMLVKALSRAFFLAAFVWVLHLAIEPTVRRVWPQKIVSWTRLFRSRRLRDPLVTRDLLVGIGCGVAVALIERAHWKLALRILDTPPAPLGLDTPVIASTPHLLGKIIWIVGESTFVALIATFLLVLALMVTRRKSLAYAAILILGIFRLPYEPATESLALDLTMRALAMGVVLLALDRSLLSLMATLAVTGILANLVVIPNPDSWLFPQAVWVLVSILGTGAWLARRACASRTAGTGDATGVPTTGTGSD